VHVELRWVTPGDESLVASAAELFDDAPTPDATRAFLDDVGHHMCIALVDGRAVGFVSGVETRHPDKGTEMLLYELAVDDAHRRRGIATALVAELRARAVAVGCYGMWVLTDADNVAAMRTYAATGASEPSTHVMFDWRFE
jgi:ribosomal protein S18 acetylase RimI-like enzyme